MSKNVNELIQSASEGGIISPESAQILTIADPGEQIKNALGVSVDDVEASEVVLVTMMIDDSGSIRFAGNAQAVRDGHNMVLEALAASKQQNNILVHTRYLNGSVLYPYCFLSEAIKMDSSNYDPNLGTPLYDQTVSLLGTVLVKSQEFAENGVSVRTVTLILTDGADEHSTKVKSADSVAPVIKDMLKAETHIIAIMGVDNGYTDFRKVFSEMGIRDEWVLTSGNNPSEIRKAFQLFSQSAVRASKSGASFSQTSLGGFGK